MYFYVVNSVQCPLSCVGMPPPVQVQYSNGVVVNFPNQSPTFPPAPTPGSVPITSASCNGCTYTIERNAACPGEASTPASSEAALCFAGDSLVRLRDGRLRRMDSLETDEWVLAVGRHTTSTVVMSPVEAWMHRNSERRALFRRIQLESGRMLKLTGNHFIYARKQGCLTRGTRQRHLVSGSILEGPLTVARSVEVGDCLFELRPEVGLVIHGTDLKARVKNDGFVLVESGVVEVDTVEEVGVYAPMTAEGNLLVNDILVSCLSTVDQPMLQRNLFKVPISISISFSFSHHHALLFRACTRCHQCNG